MGNGSSLSRKISVSLKPLYNADSRSRILDPKYSTYESVSLPGLNTQVSELEGLTEPLCGVTLL